MHSLLSRRVFCYSCLSFSREVHADTYYFSFFSFKYFYREEQGSALQIRSKYYDLCSTCAENRQFGLLGKTKGWAYCLLKCSLRYLATKRPGSLFSDLIMLAKLRFSVRFSFVFGSILSDARSSFAIGNRWIFIISVFWSWFGADRLQMGEVVSTIPSWYSFLVSLGYGFFFGFV